MKVQAAAGVALVLILGVVACETPSETPSAPAPEATSTPATAPSETAEPAPDRPNIVLIMVDDMRQDDLRFMPHTRRLVGDAGVRFVNAFSPNPLCCPARASSLTGQYSHNHRVYDVKEPYAFRSFDDRSTLATWLQQSGYATLYLGKYLNLYGEQPEPGATRGRSVRYVPPGWSDWRASIDGGLPLDHPRYGRTYDFYDTTLNVNGKLFRNYEGQYQTTVYGDIATRVIDRRAGSKRPFFAYLSFTAPHNGWPYEPDDPLPVRGDDGVFREYRTVARPPGVRGYFDDTLTAAPGAGWDDPDFSDKPGYLQRPPLNAAEQQAMLEVARQRAESLRVVDRQVLRMIRALRASGELDRTLVMFTSDNGYYLGEQRKGGGKIFPHEPSLRVPMLLRGPGIPAGAVRRDPFTSVDIAPTFAKAAGVEPGLPVDGVSMLRAARRGDQGWTRAILTESHPHRHVVRDTNEAGEPLSAGGVADVRYALGVRTPRYLYVDLATGEEELYDVRNDPEQYVNLTDDAAYKNVLRHHRRLLTELRACDAEECRTPMAPVPEPRR